MTNEQQNQGQRLTLTISEVASRLGVPASTVRGWVRRGVLPSIRLGGRRLVRVDVLEERLAASDHAGGDAR